MIIQRVNADTPSRRPARRDQLASRLTRLGLAGIVLGVAATIVAWILVDGAIDSFDDSLVVTQESVIAIAETIDVIETALGSAGEGLVAVRTALADTRQALVSTADVLDRADGVLAEAVPTGIESIRAPLPALITSSEVLTNVLSGLAILGLDYQPEPPPEQSLRAIDDALADLSNRLQDPAARLTNVGDEFTDLVADLDRIDQRLEELVAAAQRGDVVLGSYEAAAGRAAEVVDEAVADLGWRRLLARLLVVLFGALVVMSQAVPLLLGRGLTHGALDVEVSTSPPLGSDRP